MYQSTNHTYNQYTSARGVDSILCRLIEKHGENLKYENSGFTFQQRMFLQVVGSFIDSLHQGAVTLKPEMLTLYCEISLHR